MEQNKHPVIRLHGVVLKQWILPYIVVLSLAQGRFYFFTIYDKH